MWIGLLLGCAGGPGAMAAPPSPSADKDKYREAVFPQGLPVRENEITGKEQRVVYALLAEAPVMGTNRIAILYSEKNPVEQGDQVYRVRAAILERGAPALKVVDQLELTESLPVYTEFPGHVYDVDGCIESFAVTPGRPVVHAQVWAVLSGTGSISGASDLFLLGADSGKLQTALELKGTSKYSRTGAEDASGTTSLLRLVDAGEATKDVVVEEQSTTVTQGTPSASSRPPVRYRLVGERFERRTDAPAPAGGAGRLLCRSTRLAAPAATPREGAPR